VRITPYREYIQKKLGERELLQKQLDGANDKKTALAERIVSIIEAQKVIQAVAMETQSQMVFRIEDIVNKVMASVFPDYTFKLEFVIRRNKSEATLHFYKDDKEVDIMSSDGGGVVDVATIALRLAIWSLSTSVNTLLLDESGKYISRNLQPRFSDVLSELSHALNLQILLVTHSPALSDKADMLFNVELRDKVSEVTV